MGPGRRLRIRIAIVVGAGALAVAAGITLLLDNAVTLRSNSEASVLADRYLLRVDELEQLVVNAETGLRGYTATGDPLFLQPLHAAQTGLPRASAALRQTAIENHADQTRVSRLISSAAAYLAGYVHSELRLAARNLPASRSVAATLAGKRQVDAIRRQTAVLGQLLAAHQAARQSSAHGTADRSIIDAIVLLVGLTGLTLLLGGYLGHLATSRERARTLAASTVHTLQESLIPAGRPTVPGFDLAVRFLPEGGELVGGDFYDVWELVPGSWAVVLGDVCGKGAAAAAVSAMARWTLRSLAGDDIAPDVALRYLNAAMRRDALDVRFITVCFLSVRTEGDIAHVRVACAGHPAPILVPATGEPSPIPAQGDLLGVWDDVRLRSAEVELRPGDAIVAYTDGVTDQGLGARVSPNEAIGRLPARDAAELAGALERAALDSVPEQRDDIAIVALQFLGPEPVGDVALARANQA